LVYTSDQKLEQDTDTTHDLVSLTGASHHLLGPPSHLWQEVNNMWLLWLPPNWNIHHTCPISCVPGYRSLCSSFHCSHTYTAVSMALMGVTSSELSQIGAPTQVLCGHTANIAYPHTITILPTTWIQCTLHCVDQTACSANVLANCFHSHHPALIIVKIEGEGRTHFSMCLASQSTWVDRGGK